MATFDLFRNKSLSKNEQFQRNNSNESIHKICLKNGILTSVLLIMNFLAFCGITNRLEIHQLSVINMFLISVGAYFAIQHISPNGKRGSVEYFEGFKTGMYASLVSVVIHALFLLVYTYFYPAALSTHGLIPGSAYNPLTVAGTTLFEGLAGALTITFCVMQYFKTDGR
ncbi:MAG: DUF4199 domain-containing protein [Bacteroidota bacterium]